MLGESTTRRQRGEVPFGTTEESTVIDGHSVAVLGDTAEKVPTELCDAALYVLLRFPDGRLRPFQRIWGQDNVYGPLINPRAVVQTWLQANASKLESQKRAFGAVGHVFGMRPLTRPPGLNLRAC